MQGFLDDRFSVPILKPMREFVSKEILFFARMQGIPLFTMPDLLTKGDARDSLAKITEAFINSLEAEFPSTTYSLCRVASKIRPKARLTGCASCSRLISRLLTFPFMHSARDS